ncbi:Inner membrane transport permease YadH [Oligella sp. MSHR50489EDL]|uniref:ABC transporter permease n=1 Tax=Oligella sp. MSHR50489EDL TaxID=3139409 RepID=UPI003D81BA98
MTKIKDNQASPMFESTELGSSAYQRLRHNEEYHSGFPTLLAKEVMRFWRVAVQTILAPVLTSMLYLLVFSHVLEGRVQSYSGSDIAIDYVSFLIPGLIMMSMQQNAFANASSSLVQSRITGNLVFILLPPLSAYELYGAYVLGGVIRGLMVGLCLWLFALIFRVVLPYNILWVLVFAVLACGIMSTLGLIAGLWSEKFDQLALFQNFLIMPASFLSGVFYSIHSLPPFWQAVSHWNPIFYMIDGMRYGFFGVADTSPWLSLAVVSVFFVIVSLIALRLIVSGYKLRD